MNKRKKEWQQVQKKDRKEGRKKESKKEGSKKERKKGDQSGGIIQRKVFESSAGRKQMASNVSTTRTCVHLVMR